MFAPEPRQHSEDRAAASSRRVCRDEQRTEYNLQIQGVLFFFPFFHPHFFAQPGFYRLEKKKSKLYTS